MKKFNINCDFGGQMAPFAVYIGSPESTHHPLHFQAEWISKHRGGSIPSDIMQALSELNALAIKNNVELSELFVYALGIIPVDNDEQKDNIETEEQALDSENNDNNSNDNE